MCETNLKRWDTWTYLESWYINDWKNNFDTLKEKSNESFAKLQFEIWDSKGCNGESEEHRPDLKL